MIRRVSPARHGFHLPPTGAALAALPPAELARLGLAPRRAATLVRVLRGLDLERLHGVPSELVLARLGREPNLGPWSAGVVACEGLGRLNLGLAGDLGLVRIARALLGRRVTTEDTAALLAALRRVGRSGELSPPGPPAGSGAQPHGIRTAS